jgi:Cft2 family RNA processing exonuclease
LFSKESTYGVNLHEPREDRENRFTDTVRDIVTRGGKCLIPVFALGRAQELLLILGNLLRIRNRFVPFAIGSINQRRVLVDAP